MKSAQEHHNEMRPLAALQHSYCSSCEPALIISLSAHPLMALGVDQLPVSIPWDEHFGHAQVKVGSANSPVLSSASVLEYLSPDNTVGNSWCALPTLIQRSLPRMKQSSE